jgi:hypothetical protein
LIYQPASRLNTAAPSPTPSINAVIIQLTLNEVVEVRKAFYKAPQT